MRKIIFAILVLSLIMLSACSTQTEDKQVDAYGQDVNVENNDQKDGENEVIEKNTEGNEMANPIINMETNLGTIKIELFMDKAPVTAGNFKKLVEEGYYDGIIFHRVIPNFMIQGGDPTGTGTGGPGYSIKDEFYEGSSNLRGTLSMANAGPNTGGSQFFINLVDNTFLDYNKEPLSSKHPVFGKVIEGMDVVDEIGSVQTGPGDKPVEQVVMEKVSIE